MRFTIPAFLLSTVFLACGGPSTAPEPAASTGASSGGAAATAGAVQLSVQNSSTHEICYLYISPVSDPHWGPDLLGSRTLSPGETDHYEMTPGHWDIKADDCGHQELFVMHNADIDDHAVLSLHD